MEETLHLALLRLLVVVEVAMAMEPLVVLVVVVAQVIRGQPEVLEILHR
jgi:hypothetical protein